MTTVEFTSTVLGDEGAISSDISRTIVWAIAGEDIAAGKVVRLKQSTTGATVEVYDYVGTPDQDLPPYGIALETTTTGNSIPVIISGMVPNSVTGILTAATTDPVTVSSAGVPTRNAAFLGTDWVLGVVDTQARLILSKPRLGFEYRGTVRTVDNVTALRALTGHTEQTVVLSGYTTADGLGSGIFFWDTASAADDGGTRFNAGGIGTSGAGWQRVYTGPRHVTWFGARGDGVTDDSAAITEAHESLRDTGGTVFFPAGDYLLASSIGFTATTIGQYDNITWCGEGDASHIVATPGPMTAPSDGYGMLTFRGKAGQVNWEVPANRLQNFCLRDLRITGTGEHSDWANTGVVIVHIDESRGAQVVNVTFCDHNTEALNWGDARRNNDGRVERCTFRRVGGYGSACRNGQPHPAINPNCDNITIVGCLAHEVGLAMEVTARGASVHNNVVDGVGYTNSLGVFVPNVALSVQSNSIGFATPGTHTIVQGNRISNARAGVGVSSGNESLDISGNVFRHVAGPINVVIAAAGVANGAITIRNNHVFESETGLLSGTAIRYHASGTTNPAIIENNTVAVDADQFAYVIRVEGAASSAVVRNNTIVGAAWTTQALNVAVAANTAVEFVDNVFVNAPSAAYPRYTWRGTNLTANDLTGIDTGTTISTKRPSLIRHTAAPADGTWSVGDRCINTVPTAGAPFGWVCTVAGTPGTWVPFGYGLALGAADEVLQVNGAGTLNEWGKIADANIATNAAIAITKLAGGTKHREMMSWNENGDIWTIDPGQLRTIYEWRPSVGAAFGVFSGWDQVTTNGTPSHPGMGTGSFLAQSRRTQMETGVGANDIAGFESVPVAWRGTGGLGGFFFWARFAMSTSTAGTRCFIGLAESGGNANCAADPGDASSSNCIGVGYDAADTNWQVIRADGVPNVTKVNTGLAKDGVTVLELRMFCNPSASEIFVQLYDFNLGEFVVNTSYNTTLPADTMTLSAFAYCGTAASAVAQDLQLYGLRIESHY